MQPVLSAVSSGADAGGLLLELGAIILGLAVVARIARRIGLTPIPFYLIGGLCFGTGGLADLGAAEEFIEVGAEIGVILMLLMLGLEYSAEELVRNLRRSAPAGGVDLVLNFAPGLALGLLLGWDPLAAVMLGGVTYISSSGVVAKLLADLDRVGNRETPSVLTLLVIEDLVMVLYLPIVASLLFGGSATGTVITVAVAAAAAVVLLLTAVRYGERLSSLVFSGSSEVLLLSLFGITLAVAGLAERIQLSAAVGAFLVGVALSGEAASAGRALLLPLRNLFAAVFFVFFGLQVDPSLIPDVALLAGGLALVTAVTKVVTGWWAAKQAGVARRGRLRAGSALIARGEFSIVIATLGVGLEPGLGALSATYVIFLAILGPIVTRLSDPIAELPGIRRIGRERRSETSPAVPPLPTGHP